VARRLPAVKALPATQCFATDGNLPLTGERHRPVRGHHRAVGRARPPGRLNRQPSWSHRLHAQAFSAQGLPAVVSALDRVRTTGPGKSPQRMSPPRSDGGVRASFEAARGLQPLQQGSYVRTLLGFKTWERDARVDPKSRLQPLRTTPRREFYHPVLPAVGPRSTPHADWVELRYFDRNRH